MSMVYMLIVSISGGANPVPSISCYTEDFGLFLLAGYLSSHPRSLVVFSALTPVAPCEADIEFDPGGRVLN